MRSWLRACRTICYLTIIQYDGVNSGVRLSEVIESGLGYNSLPLSINLQSQHCTANAVVNRATACNTPIPAIQNIQGNCMSACNRGPDKAPTCSGCPFASEQGKCFLLERRFGCCSVPFWPNPAHLCSPTCARSLRGRLQGLAQRLHGPL